MAIAQDTPIMLFDEPTSHLDLFHQIKVMELIRNVTRTRNHASLVTMHDLNLASQYCDRLVLLLDGLILADGPPKEVLVPKRIELAYKTKIVITYHPETGAPIILPTSATIT
jgi:iron complex transport system ATP-binding protein